MCLSQHEPVVLLTWNDQLKSKACIYCDDIIELFLVKCDRDADDNYNTLKYNTIKKE